MYVLLCLLIVSSFSVIGLIGMWASTSRWHWFVRMAVVGLVLSPLLLVPAHEPFVAFVVEAVVVAAGLALFKRLTSSDAELPSAPAEQREILPRFSLTSLLCLMLASGVAAAIGVRLPSLSWHAWANTVLIGASTGVAVLLGAWLCLGRLRWWVRVPLILGASVLAAIPLARSDYFLDSFSPGGQVWPPQAPIPMTYTATSHWHWLALLPAVSLATALGLLFAIHPRRKDRFDLQPGRGRAWLRATAVGIVTALMLFLPGYVLLRMLTPVPLPARDYPRPNGYDLLAEASRSMQNPTFNNYDTATSAALQAAVTAQQTTFDEVREALNVPSLARLDFHGRSLDHQLADVQYFRGMSRALMGEARFAEFQEGFADAAGIYADTIEFGQRMSHGGMPVQALVGAAIQSMGNDGLRRVRHKLDVATAKQIARRLWDVEQRREPFEILLETDRAWLEHALGWYGRMRRALSDLAGEPSDADTVARRGYFRAATLSQLLIAELAIEAYVAEHGQPPDSLDALVPEFLPAVAIDPCSGEPLHYQPRRDDWLLYSVGYDGRDDGGKPPADDVYIIWEGGDITLDGWGAWLDSQ